MTTGNNLGIAELLAWQWEGYSRLHPSRANLWMHIVLVPLFHIGNVALAAGLITLSWTRGGGWWRNLRSRA